MWDVIDCLLFVFLVIWIVLGVSGLVEGWKMWREGK